MDVMAVTILYIILFIILAQIITWALKHLAMRKKLSYLPALDTLPFIGIALEMWNVPTDDIFQYFMNKSFQEKFKNGLYVSWMGTKPIVVMRKPHQLEVVLKSRTLISKGNLYHYIAYWLGNGLITSTGDVWHHDRRLITPAFHFNILDEFTDVIADKVDILHNGIKKEMGDDTKKMINIFPISIKFTLETVLETVMGLGDTKERQAAKQNYVTALHRFAKLTIYRYMFLPYRSDFIFYRTQKGKEYLKALNTLHQFTTEVINEKRKLRASKNSKPEEETESYDDIGKHKTKAFLDLLMDISEAEENPMTVQQLREQVDTFMFGGHDTTGIAMSYTLLCLGNVPEIQKQVQDEIDEVLGDGEEPITKEKLSQLKLLERVIKESLRLFPSAPSIQRILDHDAEVDGYLIPKGMEVAMQILHMHRDPEVWKDPLKFDPDRFLPENSHGRHPYAHIPFSAGPRNCIGQKFAMLLLKIALSSVLRKWTVISEEKIENFKLSAFIVLTPPKETINLQFIPRKAE